MGYWRRPENRTVLRESCWRRLPHAMPVSRHRPRSVPGTRTAARSLRRPHPLIGEGCRACCSVARPTQQSGLERQAEILCGQGHNGILCGVKSAAIVVRDFFGSEEASVWPPAVPRPFVVVMKTLFIGLVNQAGRTGTWSAETVGPAPTTTTSSSPERAARGSTRSCARSPTHGSRMTGNAMLRSIASTSATRQVPDTGTQ